MVATRFLRAAAGALLPRRWWVYPLVLLPSGFVGVCWWLTEPLGEPPPEPIAAPRPVHTAETRVARPTPVWPDETLEGDPAKVLLLDALLLAAERLEEVDTYTAVFHKQERLKGKLGPRQTLELKVRHRPFAVYLKFLQPQKGKEVVYAEGRHENKVIAHGGGFARLLVPRLAVAPDHPLALADSRHAVTEAGLANLTQKLIHYRKMDMGDPHAVTILDRMTDEEGRPRLRSLHTHPDPKADRPFSRVEVRYDPDTFIPVEIISFDWPEPGQTGPLRLAEHYAYEKIQFDVPLTALDFDPANPNYAFHRY